MPNPVAVLGAVIFIVLGGWHFYWALGGRAGQSLAIPEREGKPAFRPSFAITTLVGTALIICALLLWFTACGITVLLPVNVMVWLCYGLAAVLVLRAWGDCRLVGFFKRVRHTGFAKMDTYVYSPLCVALAAISTYVALYASG